VFVFEDIPLNGEMTPWCAIGGGIDGIAASGRGPATYITMFDMPAAQRPTNDYDNVNQPRLQSDGTSIGHAPECLPDFP